MLRRRDPLPRLPEHLGLLARPWGLDSQLSRLSGRKRLAGEDFAFAVLGDAEPGRFWLWRKLFNRPGVFREQLSAIQRHPVDFTVQLGDMVSRGLPRHYERFFRELHGVGVEKPYLTVCGNHDRSNPHGGSHSAAYRALLGRSNYHFDHGGVRFVVLDSSRARVTRLQLKWLSLVFDTGLRKVVFTHMPPALLRLWGGGATGRRMGGFRRNAEAFTNLAAQARVERVYMGHVHCFGVQDYKGVRYVLSGGGGSPLFPCGSADKFHHYLTVSVTAQGLRERVHSLDGSSFEIPAGKVVLPS
ncbi:MAG: metallophosphoesterase [Elusimicrobia bacterium]|nr:metallophosphoesterase [Elusimicrobiota bacterium]MDE2236985.1 metallophosphoesterase [Elusimicrobiota bacterium]MDE2426414.1 metallophosphoesterase [Elusimicrobiota bacterium]